MSVSIYWNVPTTLDSSKTYTINIYRSTAGEDSPYTIIGTPAAKSGTTYISTYIDTGGLQGYHYYLKYVTDSVEGSRILAWVEPTVREGRLMAELKNTFPTAVSTFVNMNDGEVKMYLYNGLYGVNMVSPLTSYTISSMPVYFEPVIKLGALIFIYFGTYLQIGLKDFSYSEGGLSLNVDRGSKINTAVSNVVKSYNDMLKWVKMNDYPEAIGLGSYAIAIPQGRVLAFLYDIREGS